MHSAQGVWSGSPAKKGSADNYHHGISQPRFIRYFWATALEVFHCFICILLNTAGLLGWARQLSRLTACLFKKTTPAADRPASLVNWLTPDASWEVGWFLFFCWGPLVFLLFNFTHVCVASLRGVREILDYSNHSNQCLLFNFGFPEQALTLISSHHCHVHTHIHS